MARWLLKTEPDCYSWADLLKEKQTVWNGISNASALKHLRTMKKGDAALIYHTGGERAVVGIAQIVSAPHADPKEDDDRLVVIDVKPKKALARPVSLDEIKADPTFKGWDLLRIGRLSIVPVPDAMWDRVIKLSEEEA